MTEPKTDIFDKIRAEIETEIGTKQWEDYDYCSGLIKAKRIVDKYRDQEPKTEWIPVGERLPEDGRPVLIYAWNVHHVIARYDEFRTENGYKKTWVTADAWNGNTEINHEVIAWQPLPEPYQSEVSE